MEIMDLQTGIVSDVELSEAAQRIWDGYAVVVDDVYLKEKYKRYVTACEGDFFIRGFDDFCEHQIDMSHKIANWTRPRSVPPVVMNPATRAAKGTL